MRPWHDALVGAAGLLISVSTGQQAQTPPVFRAAAEAVTVSVSVSRGNRPVLGLGATDFRLTDNGVEQSVEAVSLEAVPVDVTVFLDNSFSQSARLDQFKADVLGIQQVLRPSDRLRLLVFGPGRGVDDVFGWAGPDAELNLESIVFMGRAVTGDAVFAALVHQPAPGRRHLVVALTDAADGAGDVVSTLNLQVVAGRTESVLHLVLMNRSQAEDTWRNAAPPQYWTSVFIDHGRRNRLIDAAKLTGGAVHTRVFGDADPVEEFDRIFDEFRTSYVLHYTPVGVTSEGWHEIEVTVPGTPRADVRARRGYYGR